MNLVFASAELVANGDGVGRPPCASLGKRHGRESVADGEGRPGDGKQGA